MPQKKWLPQIGLLVMCLVPMAAGTKRLIELASAAEITAANERFFNAPVPVVLHILALAIFAPVGAFQFAPSLRLGPKAWHKRAGKILIPSGFAVALTGLWMTASYAWPPGDGVVLYATRWLVGLWMLLCLGLGVKNLRGHDYASHGNWMLRAYAIGMGAGTQVFTHLPWIFTHGAETAPESLRAVMMGAGWLINFAVAEWLIAVKSGPPLQHPLQP